MSRFTRALGATAAGVVAWSTLVEPRLFTVRRHTLPVLPAGSPPLRVLQLSDLHLAPWQHRKIAWVRRLAELRPDLLILTGDMMGHRLAKGPLLHALQPLVEATAHSAARVSAANSTAGGTAGVFVHGSNDYYGPILKNPLKYLLAPSRASTRTPDLDTAALTRGYEELGLTNLNNRAQRFELAGTQLEIFGLNDPHIHRDQPAAMREAIAELPEPPSDVVRLGVVHAPYQAALGALLDSGASVIFAGHTHGGQVRVPGVGALTSNCDLPPRLARGLDVWYDSEHAAFLNVSAGLGASIFAPIRFACRPEASLITLEAVSD